MSNFLKIEPIKFAGLMPGMDIFSDFEEEVITVVFTGRNGTDFDQKRARDLGLSEGVLLTVSNVVMESFSSEVYFREIPGEAFNTVMFLEVENYLFLNQ